MFTSNCYFASYSVAACTCVSGPYRPTDATGPRQWCYWAPAEMGRVPETWGTNGQSGNLSPLHKNSVKGQVQNSTHEENFLLKIQKGANWLLKVAILIRLFNQGSDLEQSFQSSPPVLGLWVGLSGLGPWLGLYGLGPWSLVLDLDLDNLLASLASHCGGCWVPTYRGLGRHTNLHRHTFLLYNQSVIAKSSLSCCTYLRLPD